MNAQPISLGMSVSDALSNNDGSYFVTHLEDSGVLELVRARPGVVSVSLTPPSGRDLVLTWYDDEYRELSTAVAARGARRLLPAVSLNQGRYYLSVRANPSDADGAGAYCILRLAVDEHEPDDLDDTFANANPIEIGEILTGTIGSPGDLDFYRFHVVGRGSLYMEIELPDDIRLNATFFDADQEYLKRYDSPPPGTKWGFFKPVQAGLHYLQIQGPTDDAFSSAPYTLLINWEPISGPSIQSPR